MDPLEETSDADLLASWAGGDDRAGDRLVDRHFSRVYRFFRSKVGEAARDLTQRTFLACVESRDTFRGDASFRSFLLGIARKQLLMYFRDRGRKRDLAPADVSVAQLQGDDPSPSGLLQRAQTEELLLVALRRISIDHQIAIELHYWEGMSTAEVGAVLGVATGTVHSRLSRARERLREELESISADADVARDSIDDLNRWADSMRRKLSDED